MPKEGRKFYLSWSNYLILMRISNKAKRLTLSRDKDEVMRLTLEAQVIDSPEDIFKDPYVLEFIGLSEMVSYL